MKIITTAFSHINLEKKKNKPSEKDWSKHLTNDDILKSQPKRVETYDELVRDVAQILFHNRDIVLYYRGQDVDYKDKSGKTTILPSIYRKKPSDKKLMLKENFEKLRLKSEALKTEFHKSTIDIISINIIYRCNSAKLSNYGVHKQVP